MLTLSIIVLNLIGAHSIRIQPYSGPEALGIWARRPRHFVAIQHVPDLNKTDLTAALFGIQHMDQEIQIGSVVPDRPRDYEGSADAAKSRC